MAHPSGLLEYNADLRDGDTCPHCGLVFEAYSGDGTCSGQAPNEPGIIACQEVEIARLKDELTAALELIERAKDMRARLHAVDGSGCATIYFSAALADFNKLRGGLNG